MKLEGGFLQNLGKIYGLYTGIFIGTTILLGILEQVGVSFDRRVVAALVSYFDTRGGRRKWDDPEWLKPAPVAARGAVPA